MPVCHLFCRVIDNHGDLGVCWRLARQLQAEHGMQVTLLVDDLEAFRLLAPALHNDRDLQTLDGLSIARWSADSLPALPPADLVIEGFACDLPVAARRAMAGWPRPPVWINLDYLSAEAWVAGCHRLASRDPLTGLHKHFWFPGFTPETGGLIREAGLVQHLDGSDPHSLRQRLGLPGDTRLLTLFCYPEAPVASLLAALTDAGRPTTLAVFAGKSLDAVSAALGQPLAPGDRHHQGVLTVQALPLLAHTDFDLLLAAADLNLVRGEDSFVRAQWAAQPLLWHIYPQDDAAHLVKLAAWRDLVGASVRLPPAWHEALSAWNSCTPASPEIWTALLDALPDIRTGLRDWRARLLAQEDLAAQLMRFCANRVESRPN